MQGENTSSDMVFEHDALFESISEYLQPMDVLAARLTCRQWRERFAQAVTAASVVGDSAEASPPWLQHAQRLTLWLDDSRLKPALHLDPWTGLHIAMQQQLSCHHLRLHFSTTQALQYRLPHGDDVRSLTMQHAAPTMQDQV